MPKNNEYNNTRVVAMKLNKKATQNANELARIMCEAYGPIKELGDRIVKAGEATDETKKFAEFVFSSKKQKKDKTTGEYIDTDKLEFDRGHCNNISAVAFNTDTTRNVAAREFLDGNTLTADSYFPITFESTKYCFDGRISNMWKDAALASALYRVGGHCTCNKRTKATFNGKNDRFIELGKEFNYSDEEKDSLILFYNFVEENDGLIDWKFIDFVKYHVEKGGTPIISGTFKVGDRKEYNSINKTIFDELLKRKELWKPGGILFDENLDEYIHLYMGLHSKEEGGRGFWKSSSQFTNADPIESPCEMPLCGGRINVSKICIDNQKCLFSFDILLPPNIGLENQKKEHANLVFNFGSPTIVRKNGKTYINKKRKNRQVNDLSIEPIIPKKKDGITDGASTKYKIQFKTPTNGYAFEPIVEEEVEENGIKYKVRMKVSEGELSEFRMKLVVHNKNIDWNNLHPSDYDIILTLPYRMKGAEEKFNSNIRSAYPFSFADENQKTTFDKKKVMVLDANARFIVIDWGLNPIATCLLCEATGKFGEYVPLKSWKIETLPENKSVEEAYYRLKNDMDALRRLMGQTKSYIRAKNNGETDETINELALFGQELFSVLNKYTDDKMTPEKYKEWVENMRVAEKTLPNWLGRNYNWYATKVACEIHKAYTKLLIERRTLENDICLLKLWDTIEEDYIRTQKSVYRFGQPPKKKGMKNDDTEFARITERRQNRMEHFHKCAAHKFHSWCHEFGAKIVVMENIDGKFTRMANKRENITKRKLSLNTFKRWFVGSDDASHFENKKEGIILVEVDESFTSQVNPETGELGHRNFDVDKTALYIGNGVVINADEAATQNLAHRFVCQHTDLNAITFYKCGEYYIAKGSITDQKTDKRVKGMLHFLYRKYNIVFVNFGKDGEVRLAPMPTPSGLFEAIKTAAIESKEKAELYYRINGKWCNKVVYDKHIAAILDNNGTK